MEERFRVAVRVHGGDETFSERCIQNGVNPHFMNDRLSGVEAFVQIVQAGSFSLAARRMNLTRSAVGKMVARLEQRLQTRLFQRGSSRRQILTDAGLIYYERCARIMAELAAAESELEGGRIEPSGRLRISMPVLFGRHCVLPVLSRLLGAHKSLELEASFSDRIVEVAEEGFDLAVRIGPLPDSTSLVARHLGNQEMAFYASRSYLEARG